MSDEHKKDLTIADQQARSVLWALYLSAPSMFIASFFILYWLYLANIEIVKQVVDAISKNFIDSSEDDAGIGVMLYQIMFVDNIVGMLLLLYLL